MLPKYEILLSDLKNAKQSISNLRQERDSLKEQKLELMECCTSLQHELTKLVEENEDLRSRLRISPRTPRNNEQIGKIKQVCESIGSFAPDNYWFTKKYQSEDLIFMWDQANFSQLIGIMCDLVIDLTKKIKPHVLDNSDENEENKQSTEFLGCKKLEGDYAKLAEESMGLVDTIKTQNSRIAKIAKKIKNLIASDYSHKSSRSMACLRVPECTQERIGDDMEEEDVESIGTGERYE